MNRIKNALANERGSMSILAAVVSLCLLFVLVAVSEYFRLLIIAQGVRDAVQSAVISTVNDNYDEVYHGVREGYSGAYQPVGVDFEESLDYGDIYSRLDNILGLDRSGDYHVKLTVDEQLEYRLSSLRVDLHNISLAAGSGIDQFEADCYLLLEVPVFFAGGELPPMVINVKTSAGFMPIF